MPLESCGDGKWRWGQSGKCFDKKIDAIKQGYAIEGKDKFEQIMQHGKSSLTIAYFGDKDAVNIAKAMLDRDRRESYGSKFVRSVATYLEGEKSNAEDDSEGDSSAVGDASDTDNYGKDTKEAVPDGDEADPKVEASLDTDVKTPAGNIVVPPPNNEADPDSSVDNKLANYTPITKEETKPVQAGKTITEIPEEEDIVTKKSMGEEIKAIAEYFKLSVADLVDVIEFGAVAYISQKERDKMDKSKFGDPENEAFPCPDKKHYELAWRLVGRKSPSEQAKIKKNLARIGRENGWPVPQSYTDKGTD